jgi:Tol biopolymer transport system component
VPSRSASRLFESRASNFAPGDQKGSWDVFLFERESGALTRISDESELAARSPQISGDGRWIVFLQSEPATARASYERDWSDTSIPWRVGLHDRSNGSLKWLEYSKPTHQLDSQPHAASISRDGARVVFAGYANELLAVKLFERATDQVSIANIGKLGNASAEDSWDPSISRDGRYVVFTTAAKDLDAPALSEPVTRLGIPYGERHILLRDLETRTNHHVSFLAFNVLEEPAFETARVSDGGRYVGYNHSDWRKLGVAHVGFVSDRETRRAGRLLPPSQTDAFWQGTVEINWLAANGRSVLVTARAYSVVPEQDTNDAWQVYLRDLDTQEWQLISRAQSGEVGNQSSSAGAASADLSIIVFSSYATDLVNSDGNECSDVFLLDRASGETTRIVPKLAIAPAAPDSNSVQPNGESRAAAMSEDGEFVVFASQASNFDDSDRGDSLDVFLWTRSSADVRRLSLEPHSALSFPAISQDGLWIAYWSRGTGSDVNQPAQAWSLRLIERETLAVQTVEGLAPQNFANAGVVFAPSLSGDGMRLVFAAERPVHEDGSGACVIKLYDRSTNTASVVSLDNEGRINASSAFNPVLSADGRKLAFWSQSTSLAPWPLAEQARMMPTLNDCNIFVRDLDQNTTRAANDLVFSLALRGSCFSPRLSEEGRWVSFNHYDQALDGKLHVGFVADLLENRPGRLLSPAKKKGEFQGAIDISWLSPDGKSVLVSAVGAGLPGESSALHAQVFLHQLDSLDWSRISHSATGEPANRPAEAAIASRDLQRIVFESEADNLVPGDTNNARDLFVVDREAGTISRIGAKR